MPNWKCWLLGIPLRAYIIEDFCLKNTKRREDGQKDWGIKFLLLLTDCDMDAASTILERLGEAFTKHTDIASLAYGIIEIGPDDGISLDEVVRLSDDRMFADKKRRKETER